MAEEQAPTLQDIDTLTAYLPRLYADGFSPVRRWAGGERNSDGSLSIPYPVYDSLTEEFYRRVASDGWLDPQYDPQEASRMLHDETLVRTASIDQVRSMLTFCARGERFSDGHWAEMIEKGYIRRLLERLEVIGRELRG